MNTLLLWIVLFAFIGGLISALMGWAGSIPPEPLNLRKFFVSVGVALIAGAIYVTTQYAPTGNIIKDVLTAFVFGAGGDVLINRAIGAYQAYKINKAPPA